MESRNGIFKRPGIFRTHKVVIMDLQVGVKALLKNSEGKYLLLRRNPEKYPDARPSWDIPGGRIDKGSPLFENLKREVKEETQLDLTEEPKLVAAQDILRPDKHVVRLTYVGTIEGNPVIDEEHVEAKWFSADEILENGEIDQFLRELIDNKIIVL